MHLTEIESANELRSHLDGGGTSANVVFQGLDLAPFAEELGRHPFRGSVLLGCETPEGLLEHAHMTGALVFPSLGNIPYHPYRGSLYSPQELIVAGFDATRPETYAETLDAKVYHHFVDHGRDRPDSILETLARRLHDHAITDALDEFIGGRTVYAIMGGHGLLRGEPAYRQVAAIAHRLGQHGLLLATGGGPGAMEAAHVGASFSKMDPAALEAAIDQLATAPSYKDSHWLAAAVAVWEEAGFGEGGGAQPESLGIPTWFYGHEPPTVFASHIAKYFANSVREDGLLAIAKGGVLFAPGSAGTLQEVFQDACQNHYLTAGVASPMIFLGEDHWKSRVPAFPLLAQVAAGREYARHLAVTDSTDAAVERVLEFVETLEQ